MSDRFEPKIVGFLCNWCSYRAADLAGTARIKHATNVRIIRVMCSGRVDPSFVMKALSLGADGVMIAGCHPGECHYIEQNYKAMRRYAVIKHTLREMGLEDSRVRLVWASAAEGQQLAEAIALAAVPRVVSLLRPPLTAPEGSLEEAPANASAEAAGDD